MKAQLFFQAFQLLFFFFFRVKNRKKAGNEQWRNGFGLYGKYSDDWVSLPPSPSPFFYSTPKALFMSFYREPCRDVERGFHLTYRSSETSPCSAVFIYMLLLLPIYKHANGKSLSSMNCFLPSLPNVSPVIVLVRSSNASALPAECAIQLR